MEDNNKRSLISCKESDTLYEIFYMMKKNYSHIALVLKNEESIDNIS